MSNVTHTLNANLTRETVGYYANAAASSEAMDHYQDPENLADAAWAAYCKAMITPSVQIAASQPFMEGTMYSGGHPLFPAVLKFRGTIEVRYDVPGTNVSLSIPLS